jgi:hypothetical protein
VVERPVVLTVSQVVEWLARARTGADAVAVRPVAFLTER